MLRQCFNDDWTVCRSVAALDALFYPEKIQEPQPVTLPHDAMILSDRRPEYPTAGGGGFFKAENLEYTKDFFVPKEDQGKVVYLEFEGIMQNAFVWVNGGFAGQHPYAYSNFYVNITDFLHFGEENTVKVIAKNGAQPNSRWYSGGGIYRNVKMIKGELLHIALDGVMISTPTAEPERAIVEVRTNIENENVGFREGWLKTVIRDEDGMEVAKERTKFHIFSAGTVTVQQRIYVKNPRLWNLDTPHCYTCECFLESEKSSDKAVTSFGIRSLALDPERGLQLNGSTVKLKGGCIHHDNGILGAAAFEDAEFRRARLHKEAGYNALRSAHYPMSKAMLDACDRVGLLVMDEFTDVWTSCKCDFDYGLSFAEWWERDVERMVYKDYNHPCVVLYSIGNEIPEVGSPTDASWGRKIAEKIRSIDKSRYITNALNLPGAILDLVVPMMRAQKPESAGAKSGEINQVSKDMQQDMRAWILNSDILQERIDESCGVLDVIGYNYTTERYENEPKLSPNRIVVGSETSPAALAENWALVEKHGYLLGDFCWTSWDYLGEVGIGHFGYEDDKIDSFYGDYPWIAAYSGDFDLTGFRRPISYWREIVWGGRNHTPYIAVQRPERYGHKVSDGNHNWTDSVSSWTWPGYEGRPVVAEVYSDAEEAELFINGVSVGRKPVGDEFKQFYCKWDTVYEAGEVEAVTYIGGREVGRFSIKTAGTPRLWAKKEQESLRAGTNDLCFINIELADENGIVNTAAQKNVTVSLTGAGILQASGSANPKTEENYYDTTHRTFYGRTMAVVRAGKEKGVARLSVSAEGMDSVVVEIPVV